jgi:uncharacterized lipoprotein YehR (DUF1307 family)
MKTFFLEKCVLFFCIIILSGCYKKESSKKLASEEIEGFDLQSL